MTFDQSSIDYWILKFNLYEDLHVECTGELDCKSEEYNYYDFINNCVDNRVLICDELSKCNKC